MIQSGFGQPLGDFMRKPSLERAHQNAPHELDEWHREYHGFFELGTVFTMIAGLLNILAIFDAAGGPVGSSAKPDKTKKKARGDPPAEEVAEEEKSEAA